MLVSIDPQGAETTALHDLVDFSGQNVVEIGCGDGRLTWRYAHQAQHVTGIDPSPDLIAAALKNRPDWLRERVQLVASGLEEFRPPDTVPAYDIAILSRAL